MFTIRNIGGVSPLLFGTTFLWTTPMFATAGLSTTGFNAVIHLIGSAAVLVLLLVPALERWVDGHVMT